MSPGTRINAHFMVLGLNCSHFLRKFGNKILAKCNIWGYARLQVRQQGNIGEIELTDDLISYLQQSIIHYPLDQSSH